MNASGMLGTCAGRELHRSGGAPGAVMVCRQGRGDRAVDQGELDCRLQAVAVGGEAV